MSNSWPNPACPTHRHHINPSITERSQIQGAPALFALCRRPSMRSAREPSDPAGNRQMLNVSWSCRSLSCCTQPRRPDIDQLPTALRILGRPVPTRPIPHIRQRQYAENRVRQVSGNRTSTSGRSPFTRRALKVLEKANPERPLRRHLNDASLLLAHFTNADVRVGAHAAATAMTKAGRSPDAQLSAIADLST